MTRPIVMITTALLAVLVAPPARAQNLLFSGEVGVASGVEGGDPGAEHGGGDYPPAPCCSVNDLVTGHCGNRVVRHQVAISAYRHKPFTSRNWSIDLHLTVNSVGLPTTMVIACARDTATFSRFRL